MSADTLWRDLLGESVRRAQGSPDPSSQNAGVLCRGFVPIEATWAVNQFPAGVHDLSQRWLRPDKDDYVEHAERGAIYHAARLGIRTAGLTLVCLWAACPACARAIICAGIKRLVTLRPTDAGVHNGWDDSILVAMRMLEEADVAVVSVDGPLDAGAVLRNGSQFRP